MNKLGKHHKRYNDNILILGTILIIGIFITGCTSSGSVEKFHVGTQGLVMEFSKSNPKSIYEGEEFGTALFIKNLGSHDISDPSNPARLKITFDDYRVNFLETQYSQDTTDIVLRGKSKYYPQGDEVPISFYFQSKRLTHLREGATTTINYNLCYPYTTEMTTLTCIDTKTANNDDSAAACISEKYNGGSGQGAPIVVTKIEPEILLQTDYVRPQFKIYIENRGSGYVTNADRCEVTDINDYNSSGRVRIKAWLSGELLECGPDNSGTLRLADSESYIRCYLPNENNKYSRTKKNYITPLTINLSYTYTLIEKQDVEIRRNDLLPTDINQGLCNSYQIEFEGECITRCEYCAAHPDDTANCDVTKQSGFEFNEHFKCSCTLTECNTQIKDNNCITGYCPGDLYCCGSSQCDAYQIEYKGECIDKCQFCQDHPDDTRCQGVMNLTGFRCTQITKTQCNYYSQNGACVLGFCGGPNKDNMYCVNTQKRADIDKYLVKSNTGTMNLCNYCANINVNGNDDRCTFTSGSITGKITTAFGCYCIENDLQDYPNHAIVPDKNYCYGAGVYSNYCCNTQEDPGIVKT